MTNFNLINIFLRENINLIIISVHHERSLRDFEGHDEHCGFDFPPRLGDGHGDQFYMQTRITRSFPTTGVRSRCGGWSFSCCTLWSARLAYSPSHLQPNSPLFGFSDFYWSCDATSLLDVDSEVATSSRRVPSPPSQGL